ncbi:MAG: diphosphate--fructose-6-phosphate 1-phosphotransferase [Parachlamydiaceae bacterium]
MLSELQDARLHFQPKLPKILENIHLANLIRNSDSHPCSSQIANLFPKTSQQPLFHIGKDEKIPHPATPLRVGVVLSGGQAPGGHNVISGLFDALKALHPESSLIGFLNGPTGIITNQWIEITEALLAGYRNQGGFDIIGSSRTKIETEEQFRAAEKTARDNRLDGLVVVGGDDSNTNAALLAEFFLAAGCHTRVVGVPKTIDGDLQSDLIEISFGFDTACKVYAETIGNLMCDGLSAKKYYCFIRLMGRSASHITLECALKTHPNMAIISEEVAAEKKTLSGIVESLCDLICARASAGKNYGVILIPEGLIEFIPEVNILIDELNTHLSQKDLTHKDVTGLLSPAAQATFSILPQSIQEQLLIGRDPHGNVQVSRIETEQMLIDMVQAALKKRAASGMYKGKFDSISHFCGYEGRSALPSNFDSQYCYALGRVAAILLKSGLTGYICYLNHLSSPVDSWQAGGIPLTQLMHLEKRGGKSVPVIRKTLVDLDGKAFSFFKTHRARWATKDEYLAPGPIQFYGPSTLTDSVPCFLTL